MSGSGERREGSPEAAGPQSAPTGPGAAPAPIDPHQGGIPPGEIEQFPEGGASPGAIKPGSGSIQDEADRRFSLLQGWFGGSLLALLGITIILVAVLYATKRWTCLDAADIRDYGALIVGPLITLVASVVGFYFGERRRG